ncbi:hypothetical protein, partial [Burkholderia ubonensis]|uniref:hypothetical protein n=1 Tax=Burkholderia ubonensis TaxID=101571 RepID=UPI001E386286
GTPAVAKRFASSLIRFRCASAHVHTGCRSGSICPVRRKTTIGQQRLKFIDSGGISNDRVPPSAFSKDQM